MTGPKSSAKIGNQWLLQGELNRIDDFHDFHRQIQPGNSREDAFTKIDLLAIFFIVVLMALTIIPGLANSNGDTRRAVCTNNLRQMGAAATMYANDNNDHLALPNWGPDFPGWLYAVTNRSIPGSLADRKLLQRPYQRLQPRVMVQVPCEILNLISAQWTLRAHFMRRGIISSAATR